MGEVRRDLDLTEESLGTHACSKLWVQHLESDGAVVLQVSPEIDGRHPPAAELTLDRVTTREGRPHAF